LILCFTVILSPTFLKTDVMALRRMWSLATLPELPNESSLFSGKLSQTSDELWVPVAQ
jgi:hypothetical protein